jgi:polysaccharide pyruvyl transferase WcaK-like protein
MTRLLIIGGDTDHNVGDAAILAALCGAFVAAEPGVRITVTSVRPASQAGLLPGVIAVLPKGLAHWATQLHAARAQDLVLVGGGGLFQDDDSRIKMPYWAGRLAALRAVNPQIAGHSLGAGPLRHAESRALARLACATMQSVSVRDRFALDVLAPCTARPVKIVPDPAFMLEPASAADANACLHSLGVRRDRPIIGVVLRRWFHRLGGFVPHRARAAVGMDRGHGAAQMASLTQQLAAALSRLAARLQASILLMPSYHVSHEGDIEACRTLGRQLAGTAVHLADLREPRLYKAVTGQLTLLLSARMHPLILAAGMGVPIMGMAYNSKFAGFMELLGIPEHFLWLRDLADESTADRLETTALACLEGPADLAARAAGLAQQSRQAIGALLELAA